MAIQTLLAGLGMMDSMERQEESHWSKETEESVGNHGHVSDLTFLRTCLDCFGFSTGIREFGGEGYEMIARLVKQFDLHANIHRHGHALI